MNLALVFRLTATGLVALNVRICHDWDAKGDHSCAVAYDHWQWDAYEMDFEHDVPDFCPLKVSNQGEFYYVAGFINDRGERQGGHVNTWVVNNYEQVVADARADFFYGFAQGFLAELYVEYPVGTGDKNFLCYDTAEHRVVLQNFSRGPEATIRMDYRFAEPEGYARSLA